jgi:hypothetical protein
MLSAFGLQMTEFESPQAEGRPLCYVVGQPTSADRDGYEFSYRVLSHHQYDFVDSLFLELSGDASVILYRAPHEQFSQMSRVILDEVFPPEIVDEILLAIDGISHGYNRHMRVGGLGIQLAIRDYSGQMPPEMPLGFSMRVDIRNACPIYNNKDIRRACLSRAKDVSLLGDKE